MIIYRIYCQPSNKYYIGRTDNYASRKQSHFSSLNSGTHYNEGLQNDYNKHGEKYFFSKVLKRNASKSDEERLIKSYSKNKKLYNKHFNDEYYLNKPKTVKEFKAVAIRFSEEMFSYVCKMAQEENRSISQQVITIIQEQQK